MKNRLWTFCRIAVGVIVLITFTPLVTPPGIKEPFFMGMPYTLWLGITITLLIVALTWLGTMVHPGNKD
ncbi:MAG: hypothetical protein OER04_05150 [Cyclobacteriaceae bacterium]|nr:hypothetical protein [Cyclobacteriaceae bacterium]